MIISGVTYNNKRASTSIVFYEKAQGWFNEKVWHIDRHSKPTGWVDCWCTALISIFPGNILQQAADQWQFIL